MVRLNVGLRTSWMDRISDLETGDIDCLRCTYFVDSPSLELHIVVSLMSVCGGRAGKTNLDEYPPHHGGRSLIATRRQTVCAE